MNNAEKYSANSATKEKHTSTESSPRDKWLNWLYKTRLGNFALRLVFCRRWLSKLAGLYMDSALSRRHIPHFVAKNKIDLTQHEDCSYKSFNDFFIRRLRPGRRPFSQLPSAIISPADGMLSAVNLSATSTFVIKGNSYSVSSLLRDVKLATEYENGLAVIFRLRVQDYHRYIYIDKGKGGPVRRLSGNYHTVSPVGLEYTSVWQENSREWQQLFYENIGDIIQVEVGAMMVGRIVNHDVTTFERGEEKGYFCFGGSTVVLLFKANQIQLIDTFTDCFERELPILQGQTFGELLL